MTKRSEIKFNNFLNEIESLDKKSNNHNKQSSKEYIRIQNSLTVVQTKKARW